MITVTLLGGASLTMSEFAFANAAFELTPPSARFIGRMRLGTSVVTVCSR
jgi:hypothetical protein